ncbi:kinase-like domain-containing protein [Bisporella sp. PMI_857]|nr:kinase-like domain-containing protein [Bisporella sp. PMI_857]
MASQKYSSQATLLLPRQFPSSGFEVIDPLQMVEEERLPFYNRDDYYPMRIGAVIKDRCQVVAKLGYGTSSTVWLCHDLRDRKYWILKVHVNTLKRNEELEVYRHLAGARTEHPGREYIRQLEDSFKLKALMANTIVFQQTLVASALNQILIGLNFIHEATVIHTDDEIRKPSARKQVGDITMYISRYMLGGAGPLTICDLGQARIGNEHNGKAMPVPYRAPEVILNMKWGNAAWGLLERESLFYIYNYESEELNDALHLAAMTALLGPPPSEFLNRSKDTGKWKGPVLLPEKTLESLANNLAGNDRDQFLDFVRCLLCWLPEERLTAGQAYYHPWLRMTS